MKRFIAALLIMCMLLTSCGALALTGEEALGLAGDSGNGGTGLGGSYPTLQLGSRDADDAGAYVVMLQNRLQELGYLETGADGQYGGMTESAVVAFQENNDLTPTGIADDTTQSVLYSSSAVPAPASSAPDSNVLRVQQALTRWGFMIGTADGVSGQKTETGVAEFKDYIYNTNAAAYAAYQSAPPQATPTPDPNSQPVAEDVPLSGIVDINGQDGTITEDVLKFVSGEYPFQLYREDVMTGSSGVEVLRVQRRLHQLKYLYKPDGAYGKLTELALLYYQKKNGLKETGIADRETQESLFSAQAIPAEEYVFPYKIGVDISSQRVYVYGWDGSSYSDEVKSFKCSTGMSGYDTPVGTYQSGGKVTSGMWYYFTDYNCYAKYAYRVVGGILFHSVLYNGRKQGPTRSSVAALGRKASHGCIRLAEDNAEWIFNNCPEGTTIVIR